MAFRIHLGVREEVPGESASRFKRGELELGLCVGNVAETSVNYG